MNIWKDYEKITKKNIARAERNLKKMEDFINKYSRINGEKDISREEVI
jgi:hypothetical protein